MLAVAVAFVLWRPLGHVFSGVVAVLYALPPITLGPLLVLAFRSSTSQVILAAICVCYPTLQAMRTGLRDIDPRLKDVVTLYGGSAVSTLWYVRLRSGLPALFAGLRIAAPGRDSGRHPCWVRKRRAGHRVRPAGCNRSWHSFRTMGCGTTGCNVLFRGRVRTGCATGANADGERCAGNAATGARNGAACRTMGRHAVGRHGLYAAAGDLAVPAMAGRCLTNPVPAAFRRVPLSGHQPMGT
ncbi:ABC transporter permease subunit [Komagataeibacter oboediens]|uniref:ABC transporter permease subunit n=1 Tax=Komagataeibacter oboediens TaxID=65958 RepID=A0ABS5SNC7_9PROT|nr:ABC transporter permease subunit [Komagataeibacter oboediens]MBT0675776.1 ABC transporter permease subunit [Komagataeibacter oboediens]MBT0677826.1 ABC transporter permease subunit [Komagataeibacter oboediens]